MKLNRTRSFYISFNRTRFTEGGFFAAGMQQV